MFCRTRTYWKSLIAFFSCGYYQYLAHLVRVRFCYSIYDDMKLARQLCKKSFCSRQWISATIQINFLCFDCDKNAFQPNLTTLTIYIIYIQVSKFLLKLFQYIYIHISCGTVYVMFLFIYLKISTVKMLYIIYIIHVISTK